MDGNGSLIGTRAGRRSRGGYRVKVLITSLSAGSGHVRAAEAVLAALRRTHPAVEARHVDVADFVTPNFRRFYVEGYRLAVNRTPGLWGHFYHYWDTVPPKG